MKKVGTRHHKAGTSAEHTLKTHKKHKPVVIKPKHAKAYRKRHYALLVISLAATFILFGLAISFRSKINAGFADSQNFFSKTFGIASDARQTVVSTYGFSINYDAKRYYGSAIDGGSSQLYIGSELAAQRAYQTIKLSTTSVTQKQNPDSITLDYHPADTQDYKNNLVTVEQKYLAVAQKNAPAPTVESSQVVTIHGQTFQRTIWKQAASGTLGSQLSSRFVSYTTLLNGKPLTIKTNNRLGDKIDASDIDDIANSFTTQAQQISYKTPEPTVADKYTRNRSLIDTLLFTQIAQAATSNTFDSKTISALYAPATVKVYNVYCTDISIKGRAYINDYCEGGSGTGFFLNASGYVATNGHVATENPKDLVVLDAITYAANGDGQYLTELAQDANLNMAQLASITDPTKLVDTIVDGVYNMPDSDFTLTNNAQNLLVDLNSKLPDVDSLIQKTQARTDYPATNDIKRGKVVGADYRAIDGLTRYRNSDVAIIKIDGDSYPTVKLGDISEVSQGSNLSILGYPGAASDNGIVSGDTSEVTLTTGKVSSIKNANGDSRKLIETDTTIGHGNSGGPVFADSGDVVGIATYTVDGGGAGNGTYNYIRDVQDLKTLASKYSVSTGTAGQTQTAWQSAIMAFNSSHYSKSLKYFNKVKALYPQHPTVDSFIAQAQQNIKDGKDVKDFPVGLLIAGAVVALLSVGVAVFFIVRHNAKHQVYKIATGQAATVPATTTGNFFYQTTPQQSKPVNPYAQQQYAPQVAQPNAQYQPPQPVAYQPPTFAQQQPQPPVVPNQPAQPIAVNVVAPQSNQPFVQPPSPQGPPQPPLVQ